jgi:hypothetical protein
MEDDSLKELALKHWLALAFGGLDEREYCESMRIVRKALDHVPDYIKYKSQY